MKYITTLVLAFALLLSACDNHHRHTRRYRPDGKPLHEYKEHRPVVKAQSYSNGSYAYHDPLNNVWFYLWLFDSNSSSRNTVQYVERSTYSPAERGYQPTGSTLERVANAEPKENEQLEPEGQIEAEDHQADVEVAEANESIQAENDAAIEAFENEGGNLGPDSDSDSGSDSSSDSGSDSSSSDSGSSDSGGGDSGGGDSGGGGGGD